MSEPRPGARRVMPSPPPAARLGAALCLLAALPAAAARDPAPGFARQRLDLPGMPATVLPADVDRDGRRDLVVLVAYRSWNTVTRVEQSRFDGIEGLVEVMEVVDALVDRRELRVYPAGDDAAPFASRFLSLDLATSVHSLATGHPRYPLIALTDEGVAAIEVVDGPGGRQLTLTPLLAARSSLAGRGTFYSELRFLEDLDGDGIPDLLLPVAGGWEVRRGEPEGFATAPSARLADGTIGEPGLGELQENEEGRRRSPGQPLARDVNGDGRLDVLLLDDRREDQEPVVWLQRDALSFAAPVELEIPAGTGENGDGEGIVFVGDLDGDGLSELVTQREIEPPEDSGYKAAIAHAKRPLNAYRVFAVERDLAVTGPLGSFSAIGYTFTGGGDSDVVLPGGFQDLNGDGRLDLIAITLDFSVLPLLTRILVTRRLAVRLDFHPWCQQPDGRFAEVTGLDLSGKFKINLRNSQIKHLSQFAGDFDGDGRADFVQLGRGRKVSLHFGAAGCHYPAGPSRTIRLAAEPRHLGLVRILDLDLDGRSDLYVVHPRKPPSRDVSVPADLDLYLAKR